MREINHLSLHQWLLSAIRDSQQPTSPIGFLFLKLPPLPCAVLLVLILDHVKPVGFIVITRDTKERRSDAILASSAGSPPG